METTTQAPSRFSIDATGNVVVGDVVEFTEGVFKGSHRNPKFEGTRTIRAEVVKDSYGRDKQQHTFTLRVISCEGVEANEVLAGAKIRRKGRNVYRNGTMRLPWADESQRELAENEKHERGDAARAERLVRREGYSWEHSWES